MFLPNPITASNAWRLPLCPLLWVSARLRLNKYQQQEREDSICSATSHRSGSGAGSGARCPSAFPPRGQLPAKINPSSPEGQLAAHPHAFLKAGGFAPGTPIQAGLCGGEPNSPQLCKDRVPQMLHPRVLHTLLCHRPPGCSGAAWCSLTTLHPSTAREGCATPGPSQEVAAPGPPRRGLQEHTQNPPELPQTLHSWRKGSRAFLRIFFLRPGSPL